MNESAQQRKEEGWVILNAEGYVIFVGGLSTIAEFYKRHDCKAPNLKGLYCMTAQQAVMEKRFIDPFTDWEAIYDTYIDLADRLENGIFNLTREEEKWIYQVDQHLGLA